MGKSYMLRIKNQNKELLKINRNLQTQNKKLS
jgi:hypothetical protein